MKKYRFVPKTYGWGFVPVTWQGWLFSLVLLGAVVGSAYVHGFFDSSLDEPSMKQLVAYLVDVFVIIFATLWFMDQKTDGELKWRRGKK